MRRSQRSKVSRRPRKRALALVLVVALSAMLAVGLTACGGGGIAGDYKYDSGSETTMTDFTLTLNDDDTFKLSGPNPAGGADLSISGTYKLEGDKISLVDPTGTESEVGTVDGDKLVFGDVTWVKQ